MLKFAVLMLVGVALCSLVEASPRPWPQRNSPDKAPAGKPDDAQVDIGSDDDPANPEDPDWHSHDDGTEHSHPHEGNHTHNR